MIGKGVKVEEKNLENLLEMLMNQLVKLDAILVDGDIKLKKMQVLVNYYGPKHRASWFKEKMVFITRYYYMIYIV